MRKTSFSVKGNTISSEITHIKRSSYKEYRVNALASGADEGRDKLRKAAERSKYPVTRRYPNGETRLGNT